MGVSGAALLCERAVARGLRIGWRVSAGGGSRFFKTADGEIAINLARSDDREVLPALFEDAGFKVTDDVAIADRMRRATSGHIVERGRCLGLAIAGTDEAVSVPARTVLAEGPPRTGAPGQMRVLDLSALWAGPLAANLLHLAGAEVIKVESASRPDSMRSGDPDLFARLNGGKKSVCVDLARPGGAEQLRQLIDWADIVIEAARPRALRQLGILAETLVASRPGLVWITITGHGAQGAQADWVAFGDDAGVASGLSAEARRITGEAGFVGDAIADPLTGIAAASAAMRQWRSGHGARIALAMRSVVAEAWTQAQRQDPEHWHGTIQSWAARSGEPFPGVSLRAHGPVSPRGSDTNDVFAALA